MQIEATSVDDYIAKVPEDRQEAIKNLVKTISDNLPKGFENVISYGMIGWAVPLSDYPDGYHCAPGTPLPFINLASQKNFVALYHMGIYADESLLHWFQEEYPKYSKRKLDMGKSCIRFKKMEDIPLPLIAELCQKVTPQDWINQYESLYKIK